MLSADDYLIYVDDALSGMVDIVTQLGDDLANLHPELPGANSPYAILTHCLGVMEYWGGAVVAGRPVQRDRAAEFVASGPVADLVDRVAGARRRLRLDMDGMDPGAAPPAGSWKAEDAGAPFTTSLGGVLVHIFEELARHRGHMEVTRDVLQAPWVRRA